jgi:hypothetical protein
MRHDAAIPDSKFQIPNFMVTTAVNLSGMWNMESGISNSEHSEDGAAQFQISYLKRSQETATNI